MSVDRPTRFVVAWAGGRRGAPLAERVVATTVARSAQPGIAWLSDGWEPYVAAILTHGSTPVPSGVRPGWVRLDPAPGTALTRTIKHRRGRRLTRVAVEATLGPPAGQPHPVHVERLNGVWRDRLACLTRQTHAFAKCAASWDALVSLAVFEHNWLRPHAALRFPLAEPRPDGRRYTRCTPAMAIGLAEHPWSWRQFLLTPA